MTQEDQTVSVQAEQTVIGSLLVDNDALDRIGNLREAHFYRQDHRWIFAELCRQVGAGQRADAMTLSSALGDKVDDCMRYLATLRMSAASSANIVRHAEIVIDRASKRALVALAIEMQGMAASPQPASLCVDFAASKLDELAQKKTSHDPERMNEMLTAYSDVIQQRMDGSIKPIQTGYRDLDEMLDGGLERGTLTVLAARPGMGKTAIALGVARNVAEWGSSLFLSMEMSRTQVNDRNISAMGKIPLKWLRKPDETTRADYDGQDNWSRMSLAFGKSVNMNLFIDDQTALNMSDIRAKARKVKRRSGLDLLVIDQLSFITGGKSDKSYEVVGEYTRALVAMSKELDCAVLLLAQLNRECEKRQNKRPIAADLAVSGSIEQDAANIIFLYRDDVYNPESNDRGICEVISVKQRQGEPGTVGLRFIGAQTRFEDTEPRWYPRPHDPVQTSSRRGGLS